MVMPNDLLAIKAAIQMCCDVDYNAIKMLRIKNTLKLDEIFISEHLLAQARLDSRIEILGDPRPMHFAENGSLIELW
jgi:hypothetical protein